MILINTIHEYNAINVESFFGKKLLKMGTREKKTFVPNVISCFCV